MLFILPRNYSIFLPATLFKAITIIFRMGNALSDFVKTNFRYGEFPRHKMAYAVFFGLGMITGCKACAYDAKAMEPPRIEAVYCQEAPKAGNDVADRIRASYTTIDSIVRSLPTSLITADTMDFEKPESSITLPNTAPSMNTGK